VPISPGRLTSVGVAVPNKFGDAELAELVEAERIQGAGASSRACRPRG
jgi:hypothetical protein